MNTIDYRKEKMEINEKYLCEMTICRQEAVDRGYVLGKKFIENFNKIYKNINSETVHYWSYEMQSWYNEIRDIRLKGKNKPLNMTQMTDWFYSFGSSYEEYFNYDAEEIDYYEEFIDLLNSKGNVYKAIMELGIK